MKYQYHVEIKRGGIWFVELETNSELEAITAKNAAENDPTVEDTFIVKLGKTKTTKKGGRKLKGFEARKPVSFRLQPSTIEALKEIVLFCGCSQSDYLENVILKDKDLLDDFVMRNRVKRPDPTAPRKKAVFKFDKPKDLL